MINIILVVLFILWGLCFICTPPKVDEWQDFEYEDYED